jgi:hypothetical protein
MRPHSTVSYPAALKEWAKVGIVEGSTSASVHTWSAEQLWPVSSVERDGTQRGEPQ